MSARLVRQLDKVVFVGLIGWCSSTALGAVATPPEVERARAQGPVLASLDAHMSAASVVSEPSAPRWREQLREQLDPGCVPPARPLPAWLMDRRPALLFTLPPVDPPPALGNAPGAVTSVEATSRYAVRLGLRAAQGTHLVLTQVLERRAGEGEWLRVKEVPAGAPEVTDVGLAPRTRYTWRIVSLATLDREDPEVDSALRKGTLGLELDAALARVEGPVSAEHVTLPDSHIVVSSIELDPLHPERATATLFVHRWNPVRGAFDRTSLPRVVVGQPIGDALLLEVGTAERPHPRFGWQQAIQWIKVRDADGTERVLNDKDLPDELEKVRK